MKLIKWLYPGLHVKRWLLLGLGGMFLVMAGMLAFLQVPGFPAGVRGIPAGLAAVVAGFALIFLGLRRAFRSVMETLGSGGDLAETIYNRRQLKKGPKIVVIGGGTGLSVLLRGLKEYTSNLTAIVTVADDGGSSGRLRGDQGMLPPGDVRNCLVALADKEPLMEELLQYRFPAGELAGHNLGNLLLAALNNMSGSFDGAVKALSRVLAIRGQVLPVTLEDVRLCAEMKDGEIVCGESSIPGTGKEIHRVFLEPGTCAAVKEALEAINCADAVILGPGSLYTSVVPNLLVCGIPEALAKTKALKVYVCNIMTQPGETAQYTAGDHARAILDHAGKVMDWILVNREEIPGRTMSRYRKEGAGPVSIDKEEIERLGIMVREADLVREGEIVRHHPDRLARHLIHMVMLHREGGGERIIPLNLYQDGDPRREKEKQALGTGR